MLAFELINQLIPSLKLTDSTAHAMMWMDEFRCNQLPVVHQGQFLGLVTEAHILAQDEVALIKDLPLECHHCKVSETTHFFEIIKLVTGNDIDLVGVVNDKDEYLGAITIKDTVYALSRTFAVQSPGAVILISLKTIDYSLSEISRLIESEGYKIIGSSIKKDEHNADKIKLTLKVDTEDVGRIIATLERFNYKIIGKFKSITNDADNQERLDELFKYLDI